jgi:hypothetical protein
MPEPVQYPYSLKFSIGAIVLMMILMLLLLFNVMSANNTLAWSVFGVFLFFFLFMVTLLVTQRLIPALKGNTALQLDDEGISDYIRDVSINWEDIKELSLVRGRSASTIVVGLKFESDHGDSVTIHLRWVKGNDGKIYGTMLAYFKHTTPDSVAD